MWDVDSEDNKRTHRLSVVQKGMKDKGPIEKKS
jgi:hypothetical protein